ncbi:MAG: hypothetical protein GXO03_06170 [Aquificae bacterium]|nr:hypothetical protein [Aquificota bacterium]
MRASVDSIRGLLFEVGFKGGFARGLARRQPDPWRDKEKLILNKLRRHADRLGPTGKLLASLEDPFSLKPFDGKSFTSELPQVTGPYERAELAVYAAGLVAGRLLAASVKGRAVPVVFDLFSEERSEAGVYPNADLLFLEKSSESTLLHCYDNKLFGGYRHLLKLLTDELFVPPELGGAQLYLTPGGVSFESFARTLLEVARRLNEPDPEITALTQVFSYTLDYLSKPPIPDAVQLGVLPSTSEGFVCRFPLNGSGGFYAELAEAFKRTYAQLKRKPKTYFRKVRERAGVKARSYRNLDKLKEELTVKVEQLQSELNGPRRTSLRPAKTISELRAEVLRLVRDFFNEGPYGKALVLLHSTGAGKTTAARRVVLGETDEKLVYFYFAPRKKLVSEQLIEAERLLGSERVLTVSQAGREKPPAVRRGDEAKEESSPEGLLRRLSELVKQSVKEHKPDKLACFTTTQSLVKLKYGSTTAKHVDRLVQFLTRQGYRVVFVLDELTGSDNGMYAFEELLKLVRKFPKFVTLLTFDATLHSYGVFKRALEEFKKRRFLASSFMFAPFEPNGELELHGVPVKVYSGYSYPAREIKITERFLLEEDGEKILERFVELAVEKLKELRSRNERLYVYIQNRELVRRVADELEKHGYRVLVSTSNVKTPEKELESDAFNYDAVVSTSTLSRGVSLKHDFTAVVTLYTHYLSPEENAAEDLQATARIRGMKNDEEVVKEVVRVYALPADKAVKEHAQTYADSLIEELGLPDDELLRERLRKLYELVARYEALNAVKTFASVCRDLYRSYYQPSDKVVAVLPRQHRVEFVPEQLSTAAQLFTFLNEVYEFGRLKPEQRDKLKEFIDLLYESLLVLPVSSLDELKRRELRYAHPFLLVKAPVELQLKEARRLKRLFDEFKSFLREQHDEHAYRLEELLNYLSEGKRRVELNLLVYGPSFAVAELLREGESAGVAKLKRVITRYGITVLGGRLGLEARIRRLKEGLFGVVFPVENAQVLEELLSHHLRVGGKLLEQLISELTGGG